MPFTTSTLFYTSLTFAGGVSALELAASAAASAHATCPSFIFNTLTLISSGRSALSSSRSTRNQDPMWIDDFDIEANDSSALCSPSRTDFAFALCLYLASITTLYRRYHSNQRLRNLVLTLCIGLPVATGSLMGHSMEFISVALVPLSAWAGLAIMPGLVWMGKSKMLT